MTQNTHIKQPKSSQPADTATEMSNRLTGQHGIKLEDNRERSVLQKKANNTGLPDNLKSGIESLSGYSMDDVKVHYNSSQPAQLNAHAYAQGTDIHVASGQEKHLAHEAWHVVQQKQNRVKPTMQMKGKVNVNDDAGLEKEADVMGAKALQLKAFSDHHTATGTTLYTGSEKPIQRHLKNFVDKVHTARELTKGMDPKKFAIGGSLAMQMWQLALDPKAKLHRPAGDVDIMVDNRETARPIADKIVNKQYAAMAESVGKKDGEEREEGEAALAHFKARDSQGIIGGFGGGKKMVETSHGGHKIDLKEADEPEGSKRWGPLESLMMPVEDIAEEYHLPVQSPQALLAGLEKKKAHEGDKQKVAIIDQDIEVVKQIIFDLEAYRKHAQSH